MPNTICNVRLCSNQGQLQELVAQQQSEENEHPLPRDEILSSVLGERTGYVRGNGYRKKPPKKSHIQAVNLDASVSSAMANVRQEIQAEMQAEMSRKLQEECEQMAAELKSNMEQELQRKLEEQLEHVNADVDNRISVEVAKRIQEQLAAIMTGMQQ